MKMEIFLLVQNYIHHNLPSLNRYAILLQQQHINYRTKYFSLLEMEINCIRTACIQVKRWGILGLSSSIDGQNKFQSILVI